MCDTGWRSVIEASCNVRDLRIQAIVGVDRPSYLAEFVLKRERESNCEASNLIDLETLLEAAE